MVTGYEVKMYTDIARAADALVRIADELAGVMVVDAADSLERIAEALEKLAAQGEVEAKP